MTDSPKSRPFGCFAALGVLFCLLLLAMAVGVFVFRLGQTPEDAMEPPAFVETRVASGTEAKIVHIDVLGVIGTDERASSGSGSMVDELKSALAQAVADAEVKAIVLRVDSPGGEVTASDTLYNAVKQANAKKPIVIYMDSMATSGGYYLSCGATRIVANENTWTGSIGVIMQNVGYSTVAEKIGVEMRTYRSGKYKDSLGGHRKPTAEDDVYLQNLVDQSYERFAKIVSEARQIPLEKVKAEIADGRVFSGSDALKYGLIDKTGYVEDAYALAKELAAAPKASVYRYSREGGLADLLKFNLVKSQHQGKVELALPKSMEALVPSLKPGRCYLLPSHFAN